MAKIWITEFAGVGSGHGDSYAIPAARAPQASHTVDIGASSAQSQVFEDGTGLVRVYAQGGDCIIAIGSSPNAETGHQIPLGAGHEIYLVPTGGGQSIAVVELPA